MLSIHTMGQTLDQKDLVEVVRLAFKKNELPTELIPKLDTIFKRSLPDTFIVIKSAEKFGINRQYDDKLDKVMVWDGEDIFLYNIPYWLTLLETSRKKDKALIRYETTTYGKRQGVVTKCYTGQIKGTFDGEKWILLKSKFTQTDCNFNHSSVEK